MNATMKKFGYPDTLVREYDHWVIMLRPQQVTLGALVLVCKDEAMAWSATSPEAFLELKAIVTVTEACLRECFVYDKINYLMLMMVDPDVHFHVLPRYAASRVFEQVEFHDPGWPGPPDLSRSNQTGTALAQGILRCLRQAFGRR